ncbi:MAG: AAA family ATPase [Bacteroidia bacterium]
MQKTIKIFISSSSDVKDDQEQLRRVIAVWNNELANEQIFLKTVIWEDFAMSSEMIGQIRESYLEIEDSDIFIALAFNKAGYFFREEFEVAFRQFKTTGRPFISVYFRDNPIHVNSLTINDLKNLITFKERLSEVGHFYFSYGDTDDLISKIKASLRRIFPKVGRESTRGIVTPTYLRDRVPFDGNRTASIRGYHCSSLVISGIRCFKEPVEISFCSEDGKPARWNILIGANGVGKTTLLRAMVASMEKLSNGFITYPNGEFSNRPSGIIKSLDIKDAARIRVGYAPIGGMVEKEEQFLSLSLSNGQIANEPDTREPSPDLAFLPIGYGASRHMQPAGLSTDPLGNISESLFNDTAARMREVLSAGGIQRLGIHGRKKPPKSGKPFAVSSLAFSLVSRTSPSSVPHSSARRAEVLYGLRLGADSTAQPWLQDLVPWIVDFAAKLFYLYPNSPNPLAERDLHRG